MMGIIQVVIVKIGDIFALGLIQRFVQRMGLAQVLLSVDQHQPRIAECTYYVADIDSAIVDDNDLQMLVALAQNTGHGLMQILRPVESRNEHAHNRSGFLVTASYHSESI